MGVKTALVIGNSDGIGLAFTRVLLKKSYTVIGISECASALTSPNYRHVVQDVTDPRFESTLVQVLSALNGLDICAYFAGIAPLLDLENLGLQTKAFQVNLMGAVVATDRVVAHMNKQGRGHFIGISSIADLLISTDVPSYCASKAGVSRYWEGLGLALRGKSTRISNVRLGFVDTKLAKSPLKPLQMSIDEACEFIFGVVERPRVRATKPLLMNILIRLYGLRNELRLATS